MPDLLIEVFGKHDIHEFQPADAKEQLVLQNWRAICDEILKEQLTEVVKAAVSDFVTSYTSHAVTFD